MFHAREHPNSYTLMKFSIYHASSTFGEQMPNTRVLRKPLLFNNKDDLLSFPPNEQHRSVCHYWTETDCTAGRLLLTSAGTSRLLPKCWLKERHQASVYPFMLGTYFFTVSSLSLSHTPSSLWIYGRTSNRAEPCHPVTMETGWAAPFLSHTHDFWGCRKVSSAIRGQ